jgi:ribonuclease HII
MDSKVLTPKERRRIYEEVKAEQKAKRDSWINSEEGMDFEPMEDRPMYETEGRSKQPSGVHGMNRGSLKDKMETLGEELEPGYERKKETKYKKGKVQRPIKRIDDLRKRSKEFEKYGH